MYAPTSAALVVLGLFLTGAPALAQDQEPEDGSGTGLRWRNRPSLQIGEHIRLDLRLKVIYEGRRFDPEIDEDAGDFRQRRGGINGEIGDHIEFQIEREFAGDGRWTDLFVNWRTFRQFEVTAGRFKVPFGREQNVSTADVDFGYRALVSETIAPARDKGVMVNGRFLQRGITYELGVFDDDGDQGRLREPQFAAVGPLKDIGPSYAGRLTGTPLRPLGEALETFRVGVAYGAADIPEGLNSLRGQTVYGTEDFFPPVFVNGRRTRVGAELTYTPGPLGFAAEWMRAREQRLEQGLGDDDLSDFLTTGWYASATWLLTGEDKEDFNNPRRPLFGGGIGAIEVGARVEELRFESEDKTGPAFRNPRAAHILGNRDRVVTLGVNWWASRWTRLTLNAIREQFDDPPRTPVPGTTKFWSGLLRMQVVF
jgi:phosphate-selective porin OprO/OprP